MKRIWTAEEFERLTPVEQDAVFDASIEYDLTAVPTAFVEAVRMRTTQRIVEAESDTR